MYSQDFIVVTEFSEAEGPIAIETIPKQTPDNFNLSKFALRVLGSEFRKRKSRGSLPTINVADMQQFFEDHANNFYVYVCCTPLLHLPSIPPHFESTQK